jgi:hypothetical protein
MDLSGIISISGRPGLFKVIAQGKNNIIVESIIDKKRFPAYSSDRISALEDISIYTHDDDRPLKDIFDKFHQKLDGKAAPSHKEDIVALQEFLSDILPDYDEERIYISDIQKLFQWYNILHTTGNLNLNEESETAVKDEKINIEDKTTKVQLQKKHAVPKKQVSSSKKTTTKKTTTKNK